MKKLNTFGLISILIFTFFVPVATAQFSDIKKDSLSYMYAHGIIDGYPDGTFGPQLHVNRAELLKMIMDASHKEVTVPAEDCFSDVKKDEWYAPYICTAEDAGWIEGYADGQFKPAQFINKVETLKIIAEVQGWENIDQCSEEVTSFSDVVSCSWYFPYVVTAEDHYFIDEGSQFYPGNEILREEVAEILFRTIIENKLGRIGDQQTEMIDETVSAMARDFFSVEDAAALAIYDNALTEFSFAEDNPHHVDGLAPEDAVYENRTTMINGQDGFIYAVLPVPYEGELESDHCPQNCTSLWMIAKFNQENDLVAYEWMGVATINHQFARWNLVSANDNEVIIETWYDDSSEGTFTGKSEPFIIVMEDIR